MHDMSFENSVGVPWKRLVVLNNLVSHPLG